MAHSKPASQDRGSATVVDRGYQPQVAPRQPIGPAAGGVQGGYQPATGQQVPQPPNEGSGVQPPAKKD